MPLISSQCSLSESTRPVSAPAISARRIFLRSGKRFHTFFATSRHVFLSPSSYLFSTSYHKIFGVYSIFSSGSFRFLCACCLLHGIRYFRLLPDSVFRDKIVHQRHSGKAAGFRSSAARECDRKYADRFRRNEHEERAPENPVHREQPHLL